MTFTVYPITPGRYRSYAEAWVSEFPELHICRGYQLDASRNGASTKHPFDADSDGDIDDADADKIVYAVEPARHLAVLSQTFGDVIPLGAAPGLVSLNDETCAPWWFCQRKGYPREQWVRLFQAWILEARHLIPKEDGWLFGIYGWPRRPWNVQNSVAASDAMLDLFSMADVITPNHYDPAPKEFERDLRDIYFLMAESARLSSMLDDKPIVVQTSIRVRGNGAIIPIDEWRWQLDKIAAWKGKTALAGIALWSDGKFEEVARQTSTAMSQGHAQAIIERFGS